jgi:hypothetical protein
VRVYGGGSLNVAPVGGTFTNAGYLFLNNSTKLSVQGDYVQTETGTLDVGIAGPSALNAGSVVAAQNVTVDGTLTVTFENGYIPMPGAEFIILSAPSITGQFAALNTEGQLADPVYEAGRVLLHFI